MDRQRVPGSAGARERGDERGEVEQRVASNSIPSPYDDLSNFLFREGPYSMPSSKGLVTVDPEGERITVAVHSPRLSEEGAAGEPTYLEVFRSELDSVGREVLRVPKDVILDLSKVIYMVSTAVVAVEKLRDIVEGCGRKLMLQGEGSQVYTLLQLTGFHPAERSSHEDQPAIPFPTSPRTLKAAV